MTLHFQECLDLRERQVLPIPEGHQLVVCAEQFERIAQDLPLVQALANTGSHLSKEMKAVDILQDVRLAVCDQDDVELVEGLVDEADIVLLNGRVLGTGICEFRERRE